MDDVDVAIALVIDVARMRAKNDIATPKPTSLGIPNVTSLCEYYWKNY
jgi:hypothetical protein